MTLQYFEKELEKVMKAGFNPIGRHTMHTMGGGIHTLIFETQDESDRYLQQKNYIGSNVSAESTRVLVDRYMEETGRLMVLKTSVTWFKDHDKREDNS